MDYIQKGTNDFRKVSIAFLAGGFNNYAILYCTQPIMPFLSREFNISPAVASLSLSVTTIALAVSMLFSGSVSEVLGRKPIMLFSVCAAAALEILTAVVPNFHYLLVLRALQGFILAGFPAVAMAYISEEVDQKSLGMIMGLYISGLSISSMAGRIIVGSTADFFNWRVALACIGVLGAIAAALFWAKLPSSKHFQPRSSDVKKLLKSMFSHLNNRNLLCLYGIGFLVIASFVSTFNYIGYQLIAPPYSIRPTFVSLIFLVYSVGTFSSTWMGHLADQYGYNKILCNAILIMLTGALITLNSNLLIKIAGIAVLTFGYFGAFSIASSSVGRLADHNKAQASSLYLFFFYIGSSVGGTAGGIFWASLGWSGVIIMIACFLMLALFLSIRLSSITPLINHACMKEGLK